jgi:hypothetical protein
VSNPPQQIETITIRSFDDAWRYFQLANNNEALPERFNIIFEGWPSFDLRIDGKDWNGTVPTRVMSPLLDVQRDIHRLYSYLCMGGADLRRITDSQRSLLELVIKVEKGSSDYKAALDRQFTEIAKEAIKNMESKHILIAILGVAFIYGANDLGKQWIASQQAAKQVEQTVALSKQETERLKIFAEATKHTPALKAAVSDYEATQNKILKVVKHNDKIKAYGVEINGYEAQEITHKERANSSTIEITGLFRVMANDASKKSGYRIKVTRISDGESFAATVPFDLDYEQQQIIQKAEWSKGAKTVDLTIKAAMLRGKVTNAEVVSASEPAK